MSILEKIIEFFKKLFSVKEESNIGCSQNNNQEEQEMASTTTEIHVEPEIIENKVNTSVHILIDNGHGNDTVGKKSPYSMNGVEPKIEFEEWNWNRQVSHEIVTGLKKLGYSVHYLVTEINDISLKNRVKRVKEYCNEFGTKNVILISIHSNASGDGSSWMKAHGWSAFTTKGDTSSDKLAECFYNAAFNLFEDKDVRTDFSDGDRDYEEDFYIIKKTPCTAVLTENFFYDNIKDAEFITTEEGISKISKLHINGIIDYLENVIKEKEAQ